MDNDKNMLKTTFLVNCKIVVNCEILLSVPRDRVVERITEKLNTLKDIDAKHSFIDTDSEIIITTFIRIE
uniref:Uncharacterized protein n=1 Tax=viral metagenome TaxID=1070528 RepID=A0A6M3KZ18_9ZZZZ